MIARIIPILRLPPTAAPYYDYTVPVGAIHELPLQIGHIVKISFHGRTVEGVVIQILKHRSAAARGSTIKSVKSIAYPAPLITPEQIKLAKYLAKTANISTALAMKTIAPYIPRRFPRTSVICYAPTNTSLTPQTLFTPSISSILKSKSTYLFHYDSFIERDALIQKILKSLPKSKQLLILVPEISDIEKSFESIAGAKGSHYEFISGSRKDKKLPVTSVIHSRLSKTTLFSEYLKILNPLQAASCKLQAKIIIGAKRSLFMPFANLGAIILDQEHSPNHDNFEQKPYYSGRDIADFLRIEHQCPLILASYAPLVETWQKGQTAVYKNIHIKKSKNQNPKHVPSKVEESKIPAIRLVDMIEESRKEHYSILSDHLRESMQKTLFNSNSKSSDIFIFHNRKGYSTIIKCKECGYTFICKKCDKTLVQHMCDAGGELLRCHTCGYQEDIPPLCPECDSPNFRFLGKGTQKIISILRKEFSDIEVIRIDKDIKDKSINSKFQIPNSKLIVGTEYALSRLDWPRVALVGIINIDPMLVLPDARAYERVYQIIRRIQSNLSCCKLQAASCKLIIQTHSPRLPIFQALQKNKPGIFYRSEIEVRK